MSGFDKSRFIGLSKADEELICGICLAILNEPVVTPCCSQTYCGECVRQWLTSNNKCPNDRKVLNANQLLQPQCLVKNMLDKLEIICDFNYNGCEKRVSLCQLKNHVNTCRYNPNSICAVCNEKIGDIDEHYCNSNLMDKNKCLEISYKELLKKHNAFVENANKEIKNKEIIITELNKKITNSRVNIEENKRLKSDKREMNKRMKIMTDFANKSDKQLNESIKQMSVLRNEFKKIKQNKGFVNTTQEYHLMLNHSTREESNEEENNNKILLQAVYRYRIEDVHSLRTDFYYYSPPILAHGFKWRLMIGHFIESDKTGYMKCFLECNHCVNSTQWSIEVNFDLNLVSTNVGQNYANKLKHKFTPEENNCGLKKFISWKDLSDPRNGFLIENSITLEAVIRQYF